jgi:hypothetical protein
MASLNSDLVARFPDLDADALKEIIETDLPDTDLNNFLNMGFFATRPLAGDLGNCGGKNAEEMIVKLMAAHFLTAYEQQPVYESIAEWSIRYRGEGGTGLNASLYGQQAVVMDCSGTLAKQAAGLRPVTLEAITYNDINDPHDTSAVI